MFSIYLKWWRAGSVEACSADKDIDFDFPASLKNDSFWCDGGDFFGYEINVVFNECFEIAWAGGETSASYSEAGS